MEEENPNIRVVFVGDKRIGNNVVKFFKERNKKCFNHVTGVDFYVMSMKIKDFKDVNFNIIILKSFNPNDDDNFYKKNFVDVPAAVFVWDKTSKKSYNVLREALKGVNQLTNPNAFKAIVSANEGKQKDIAETAELDRIAKKSNLPNYIVNFDDSSILEKLFADIARKILNIPVTFEKPDINNQEEEYGYEFQEPDIKEKPKDFNGSSSHVNSSRSSGAQVTQDTPSPETQEQKEGKKCLDCCIII